MTTQILINAVDPEEVRFAIVKDNKLDGFYIESAFREITQGNIYKGIITRIEPGLHAVFVDYGVERHGFLQKNEIHSDYFQDSETGDHSLKNILKRGQELLVQVTKEPIMKKGGMLTTFISLPGRFLVLMPGSKNRGISRKIDDEKERKTIKEILDGLKIPDGFGVIVRTAGQSCTKTQITKDLNYLLKLWKNIKKNALKAEAPSQIFKDRGMVFRSLRDYLTPDVGGILVDNPAILQEIKDFIHIISPKHTKLVKLHKEAKPIFSKYELEKQIASIFENRVQLKSGGSIVIEQTEAMVSIDVNSGKGTHKSSIEKTAFLTNTEAAEEVARQLRLRDLGGLIVIDFIDMKDRKHKAEVVKALKNHIKADRARTKVGAISQFGLLEMSRQRIRPSIDFGSFIPCNYCNGKGQTPSIETLGLTFLRQLRIETLKNNITKVEGRAPVPVADYILNKKRREILDLEMRRDLTISIQGVPGMSPGEIEILSEKGG